MTAEQAVVQNPANDETSLIGDSIDVTTEKDGGVLKQIKKAGENVLTPGYQDRVTVHYVGTLTDGTKFDSSRDRGEYFEFTLGKGEVIKAWDLGVATMKKGEISIFECKPAYAYGEAGSPPKIPENATLIFEIELIDWKGEDLKKDGGILKSVLVKGEGYANPNDGALVEVDLLGRYQDHVFDHRTGFRFVLGEGCDHNVCPGIEIALEQLRKGEKVLLTLQPQYAFGSVGKPEWGIPGNHPVQYEVFLKTFEKAKDSWELNADEKIEQCKHFKTRGTHYLQQGKYDLAVKNYKKIVDFLEFESDYEQVKTERNDLLLAAHLNLSLTYLNQQEFKKACDQCDKALALDPNNVKALYRRGKANTKMSDFSLALDDFQRILELDPSNRVVRQELILCRTQMLQAREKEKQLYANMFKPSKIASTRASESVKTSNGSVDVGAGDGTVTSAQ